ncbi:MAG: primosomal protein N' [Erysipelotrichaceae bacterium]|nr:primosomal protein N' [Erysipelotrichaceae bacterium]
MYLLEVLIQHPIYNIDQTFYYLSSEETKVFVRVAVTFNKQEIYGFVTDIKKTDKTKEELEKEMGFTLLFIKNIVDKDPIISPYLYSLASKLASRYSYPIIGVLQTMLPPALRPSDSSEGKGKIKYIEFCKLNDCDLPVKLKKNEMALLEDFDKLRIIEKSKITRKGALKSLIEKGFITTYKEEAFRYKFIKNFDYESEIILSDEQQIVFDSINKSKKNIFLINGITGSGKTEVYIKLIQEYIDKGKSCIILVPEIGLTPLMISRILSVFPDEIVGILHSSLTNSQKYDEYRKAVYGKTKILIGTRSAIFVPIKDLGLIVIDEEHDDSYKQDDRLTYHARDVALLRAKDENLKVILGSATPSIESMVKAKEGKYELLTLTKRYYDATLPNVIVVDRNKRENFSFESSVFSIELIKQLKLTIAKGEQAILLINNRGFARNFYCRECGFVFKCPTCGLPLTYHKEDNSLKCHHCDYSIKKPNKCPDCGSTYFGTYGFGIEKVEEDFKHIFKTNYLLLDGDRTTKSSQIAGILKQFDDGVASVLIGTQIVAKGHDFSNVTLVGIINADTGLNLSTYRAKEMTFELITQAIGRCGRKELPGLAIVQTSQPKNYAIVDATNQNYDSFFIHEISERKLFKNPPFYSLVSLKIAGKDKFKVNECINQIKKDIIRLNESIIVYGPTYCEKNFLGYTSKLYLKSKMLIEILDVLGILISHYKSESGIRLLIDVNPYN